MQKKSGVSSPASRRFRAPNSRESRRVADTQLRAVINSSPIPTLVSRMEDGRIIYANEHLARLLGLKVKN